MKIFIKFTNYYCRFIKDFFCIAAPLNKLTEYSYSTAKGGWRQQQKKLKKLNLDLKALKTFKLLKKQFKSAPLLIHFRPKMPIRIETDASRFIILGILS